MRKKRSMEKGALHTGGFLIPSIHKYVIEYCDRIVHGEIGRRVFKQVSGNKCQISSA